MAAFVYTINRGITALFSVVLWPFRSIDPFWAVTVVSLLSGLAMLWIFARVSNQDAIGQVRERIRGNLLGVRLYRHEIGVVLRLQGSILRGMLSYLKLSLAPVAVLLVPVLLILVQLNLFFSLRPLLPGETTIVKIRLPPEQVMQSRPQIAENEAYRIETPPVRMVAEGEIAWRLKSHRPGRHNLAVYIGDRTVSKELVVGDRWGAVSRIRTRDWLDLFLYSGETPLPAEAPLYSIEVVYPSQSVAVLGWEAGWLVLFLVFSLFSAFSLKGLLGVEI